MRYFPAWLGQPELIFFSSSAHAVRDISIRPIHKPGIIWSSVCRSVPLKDDLRDRGCSAAVAQQMEHYSSLDGRRTQSSPPDSADVNLY